MILAKFNFNQTQLFSQKILLFNLSKSTTSLINQNPTPKKNKKKPRLQSTNHGLSGSNQLFGILPGNITGSLLHIHHLWSTSHLLKGTKAVYHSEYSLCLSLSAFIHSSSIDKVWYRHMCTYIMMVKGNPCSIQLGNNNMTLSSWKFLNSI